MFLDNPILWFFGTAVGVGLVVYRVSTGKNEGRRKEIHDKVQRAISVAHVISAQATEYFQLEGSDQRCDALGTEIRKEFRLLGTTITDLHHIFKDRSLLGTLTRFRKSASGELDTKLRKASSSDSNEIREIESTCGSLCNLLLSLFHSRFK